MKFAEIPIRIRLVKRESNIDNHLRWLDYITSGSFLKDWKASIETGDNIQKLVDSARQVVEENIYKFNTTDGTGSIKESFQGGTTDEGGLAGLGVFSNPAIAPSVGTFESGVPERFSYAAFFEDPEFNSFIPPRDEPTNIKRHRPFMAAMAQHHQRISGELTLRALFIRLRRKMPKMQG